MIPRSVKAPTIPIPFHKLLKVVAIVDAANPQTKQLLDHIAAENFEVEVTDSFDRDVSEDAAVGAYIALIDGDRLERARQGGAAVRAIGFRTPLWALADSHRISDLAVVGGLGEVDGYIYLGQQTPAFYAKQVVASVVKYGMSLLPPFFGGLVAYDAEANIAFDCPGHQGGQFYRKSPAGQLFFKHFGESVFRNDLCNADVDLGDLLIHEGAAADAQRYAAQVFGADKTYFVLNGTSTSNKVVTNAVLRRGDLVLFDRNNHKSLHQGALVGAGAIPIFLPTSRNAFGMIGAVDWDAWDEDYLREQIRINPRVADKQRHKAERPFRLACIQLATYDGTIYNVRKVLEKIGHLCDYVLWDEAWIGYNAFHPLFEDHSPMRLQNLNADMAGLFSTQSVHKQGAGFSQASQIHKRDEHIRGQRRYIEHKRFNESFLMHASTSPFYPLFASLEVNAKVHEGKAGEMLWDRCIELGIEARKKLREFGRYYARTGRSDQEKWFFDPFVPDVVTMRGSAFHQDVTDVPWEDLPTEVIKREQAVLEFSSCRQVARLFRLRRRLRDGRSQQAHVAHARDRPQDRRVPELRSARHGGRELPARAAGRPGEVRSQQHPVPDDAGGGREQAQHADREARQVQESVGCATRRCTRSCRRCLRRTASATPATPCGRSATRCTTSIARRTSRICSGAASGPTSFPELAMSPKDAYEALVANEVDYVPLSGIKGRISATLALIYPPGIGVVVPGERWDDRAQPMLDYFLAFQESFNRFPGFNYEVQGVFQEREGGRIKFYTYVVRE